MYIKTELHYLILCFMRFFCKKILKMDLNNLNYTLNVILLEVLIFKETSVAQLVEALRYKSEGRGFDSR